MVSWPTPDLERLELLVPEIARSGPRDLTTAALAYVDRYEGDVLQLDQEWEFLYAALRQAGRRAADGTVVRLVGALAHVAGRLDNPAVAEHILRLGIEASRRAEDRAHLAAFQNRLGGVLFARGRYRQGRHIWRASLNLTSEPGVPPVLWEPFATFALIADIQDGYDGMQQFVAPFLTAHQTTNPDSYAMALFVRGFHTRVRGDLARAAADYRDCLRIVSRETAGAAPLAYRQLFTMVVQAELARLQLDYGRAQDYAETALGLARLFGDRYTLVDLLVDQVVFAADRARFADTQVLYGRLCDLARQTADPYCSERCRALEHRLGRDTPRDGSPPGQQALVSASLTLAPPLSDREIEVLELVAAGLASGEIARRLVVTPGTVKKHLEHIYGKLDVHSRTSALARARTLRILS